MKKPFRLGRRHFLLGAGSTMLAVPFLPSLTERGHAQPPPATKCFVSWRISNGYFGHQWYPQDSALGGLRVMEPNVREMALSDITGPISPLLGTAFDPFRSKMTLMRHIDRLDHSDHNPYSTLFGWNPQEGDDPTGLPPSIDQLIATHATGGSAAPLNLTVHWSSEGRSPSFSVAPDGTLVMEPGLFPDQAYQRLFGDFMVDESTADRRRGYLRTIVDRVLPHYQAVRDNRWLSSTDRDRLDQHVEHMHQVQQRLARSSIRCEPPARPSDWNGRPEAVNDAAQAQVDIAIAALRCGLTPVVNFYLDPDTLMTEALHGCEGHHAVSHVQETWAVQQIENAHRWSLGYLVDFLTKLDESIDPMTGGSLLDSSLVFLSNEIGNQAGPSGSAPGDLDLNHLGMDTQVLLIGSAGGALRTGLYLDYRTDFTRHRWTRYIGTAYNRVLVSCMLAMGLTPDQWEVPGHTGYGDLRGGLYGVTPPEQTVIGDLRAYLPRLAA